MNTSTGLNVGEANIPALVRGLLGEPNKRLSRGHEWRFGSKGSLAVDVVVGRFMDFEAGEGGGMLDLVRRVRGGSRADAAKWIERQGLVPNMQPYLDRDLAKTASRPCPRGGCKEIRSNMWRILWGEGLPPEDSPVSRYLEGRGLALPIEPGRVLRFHPACPFGRDRSPAMVALIRNTITGKPQGLHRTPLTPSGQRARGPNGSKLPKMALGATCGGAVLLCHNRQVETALGIAEGIESALGGLRRTPWLPVWAAISAGGVRTFPVLAGIEALTVYADNDAKADGRNPGLEAARSCAERWAAAGRHVEVIWPRAPGADMADLVQACAET